jgi:hypothetical protein
MDRPSRKDREQKLGFEHRCLVIMSQVNERSWAHGDQNPTLASGCIYVLSCLHYEVPTYQHTVHQRGSQDKRYNCFVARPGVLRSSPEVMSHLPTNPENCKLAEAP